MATIICQLSCACHLRTVARPPTLLDNSITLKRLLALINLSAGRRIDNLIRFVLVLLLRVWKLSPTQRDVGNSVGNGGGFGVEVALGDSHGTDA